MLCHIKCVVIVVVPVLCSPVAFAFLCCHLRNSFPASAAIPFQCSWASTGRICRRPSWRMPWTGYSSRHAVDPRPASAASHLQRSVAPATAAALELPLPATRSGNLVIAIALFLQLLDNYFNLSSKRNVVTFIGEFCRHTSRRCCHSWCD